MKAMIAHRMKKILLVLLWFGIVCLAGCANFINPEIGAIARPDARIELVAEGVQNAAWTTRDLTLTYSYTETGDAFNLSGTLSFDRSLTNSFTFVKTFFLKMSFLDSDGRVLETTDITPMISSFTGIPNEMPFKRAIAQKPAAATAIAFNYFGVFRSGNHEEMGGDGWEIFYFPFD